VIETRTATPQDERALAEIDRATWSSLTSPAPKPDAPDRHFFTEKIDIRDVIVAFCGGEVAGYVRLDRASPLAASDHVLMINGIAVDPAHQRRGVGRALIDAAVTEARRRGKRRLRLRVLAHNEPARRLYDSAGFVVEGTLRGEFCLDGKYVDDLLMVLDLS